MSGIKVTAPKEPSEVLSLERRVAIKSFAVPAVMLGSIYISSSAISSNITEADSKIALVNLISSLRRIEKKVCDSAAQRIEKSLASGSSFNLHLRSAGLDLADAVNLAKALEMLSNSPDAARLSSFSVSYNDALGDHGTVAFAQALPRSVQEIGFVGCNMRDEGALALLKWAKQTSSLKMICIEQNNFSADTRLLYQQYKQGNPGATVYF